MNKDKGHLMRKCQKQWKHHLITRVQHDILSYIMYKFHKGSINGINTLHIDVFLPLSPVPLYLQNNLHSPLKKDFMSPHQLILLCAKKLWFLYLIIKYGFVATKSCFGRIANARPRTKGSWFMQTFMSWRIRNDLNVSKCCVTQKYKLRLYLSFSALCVFDLIVVV